jgi:hypothetical protein
LAKDVKDRERRRRTESATAEGHLDRPTRRCPYCHDSIAGDTLVARCARCDSLHHASCFEEQNGCSIDGCGGKAAKLGKGTRREIEPCAKCEKPTHEDEHVAVCEACSNVFHVDCLKKKKTVCPDCEGTELLLVSGDVLEKANRRAERVVGVAVRRTKRARHAIWLALGLFVALVSVAAALVAGVPWWYGVTGLAAGSLPWIVMLERFQTVRGKSFLRALKSSRRRTRKLALDRPASDATKKPIEVRTKEL